MHCKAHFRLQDMLLNLPELSFEGQNMKYTENMLLTCILYCVPGPAAIRTNVFQTKIRFSKLRNSVEKIPKLTEENLFSEQ